MKVHLINYRDRGFATTICRPNGNQGDWKEEDPNYHTDDDDKVTCGNCRKIRGTN